MKETINGEAKILVKNLRFYAKHARYLGAGSAADWMIVAAKYIAKRTPSPKSRRKKK